MLCNEKIAFERLRNGTLSKEDCVSYIDYYMNMKPIWFRNGKSRLFRQACRKDRMMGNYFIEKFVYVKG